MEVTPFYGYRFGGDISEVENARDVKIAEGSSYGFMLDIQVEPGAFVELRYSRQSTELKASDSVYGAGQVDVTDIDVDHFMLGGTYEPETSHPIRPFVSADLAVRRAVGGHPPQRKHGHLLQLQRVVSGRQRGDLRQPVRVHRRAELPLLSPAR